MFAHRSADGYEVLLCRRNCDPDRGKWSVPGGRQEPSESYRQTAVREAEEELLAAQDLMDSFADCLPAGFAIEQARKHAVGVPPVFSWRTYLIALTRKPHETVFQLNSENSALRWFSVKNLPEGVHWLTMQSIRHFGLHRERNARQRKRKQ
jgi:8-oxo-dGTP pyrophosphatase MutT (NUDIX family)